MYRRRKGMASVGHVPGVCAGSDLNEVRPGTPIPLLAKAGRHFQTLRLRHLARGTCGNRRAGWRNGRCGRLRPRRTPAQRLGKTGLDGPVNAVHQVQIVRLGTQPGLHGLVGSKVRLQPCQTLCILTRRLPSFGLLPLKFLGQQLIVAQQPTGTFVPLQPFLGLKVLPYLRM